MASKRVALVACKNSAEGPWTSAKGNEVGFVVRGLGEDEQVVIEMIDEDGDVFEFTSSDDGLFILAQEFARSVRYRVKKVNGQGSPTTVEIYLNESAQGQSRHTDDRTVGE